MTREVLRSNLEKEFIYLYPNVNIFMSSDLLKLYSAVECDCGYVVWVIQQFVLNEVENINNLETHLKRFKNEVNKTKEKYIPSDCELIDFRGNAITQFKIIEDDKQ